MSLLQNRIARTATSALLLFFSAAAHAQTNPLCRMTYDGCAFHGWETSACSFVYVADGPPLYDGRWWRSVSFREQIGFLDGFRDCYVFEFKGPMQYSLVAPFEWQREISAWYARTPSALEIPAAEFMLRSRAWPDRKHIASREDGFGAHGNYDGGFWRQARALGGTNQQRGFVAGYLWCHANVARNPGGTFSKSPDDYARLITQWYANDGTVDRDSEKIADVLFHFRDPEPRVTAGTYPGLDAFLIAQSNFVGAAEPPAKSSGETAVDFEAWRSNGYPNFQLSAPAPATVALAPGGSVVVKFSVTKQNGFRDDVALSATGLPRGIHAAFAPGVDATSYQLTLSADRDAPAAASTIALTGSNAAVPFSGGHRVTLPLLVSANTSQVAVNLQPVATLYALGNDHLVLGDNGGIDGAGFAYSGILLGSGITWDANAFAFGPPANGEPGSGNGVAGATIPLPAGRYASLKLLGCATGGARSNQAFVVTYTDGTSATFTQSLSDWTRPENFSGETVVATNAYCDLHVGTFTSARFLYGYAFPLDRGKFVKSFKMPGASSQPRASGVVAVALTLGWDADVSPDFTLSASPRRLAFGDHSTVETVITVDALNNFSGPVDLSASGLPPNVTASFAPSANASRLRLTTSDRVATGRFTLSVTGVSGGVKRSVAIDFE